MSGTENGRGRTDSPLERSWEHIHGPNKGGTPEACVHELGKLAVSEKEVKAIHARVTVIVGDRDPCRRMYVEPLQKIRPDWPVHIIDGAGHLNCIMKPDFKTQLKAAIDQNASAKP